MILPKTARFPWPTLLVQTATLIARTQSLIAADVRYGLGAKAPSLACAPSAIHSIDCSGFVRWALYQASGTALPDGSVNQHDWCDQQGFKRSDVDACTAQDDVLRIAFLSPSDGGGIGHVMLVLNGYTLESHGGKGPDRRKWDVDAHPFMGKCAVYVLTAPPSAG